MSAPLQPAITEVGLAAIWRASNDGVAAQITHIALGDSAYAPSQTQTKLRTEKARYPVSDGQRLSNTQIHLTAVADDTKTFWVREVGFYLSDGTLLAVWSDPAKVLAYKSAEAELLLAYDLSLSALPSGSVTIESSGAGLNLTLAEELAALATGQISEAMRGIDRDDQLATATEQLAVHDRQIGDLQSRVSGLSARDYDNLIAATAANATAVISLQHLFAQTTLGVK